MHVVPAPKFQTGDRVKVRHRSSDAWITEPYGTVVSGWDQTDLPPMDRRKYRVMFYQPQTGADGSGQIGSSSVSEDDLEPAY